MTTIYLSEKDGKHRIRCEGHATGSPEVCGAISALCCTVASCALKCTKVVEKDGFFDIEFTEQYDLFHFARTGFKGICEEYGNYCKITV